MQTYIHGSYLVDTKHSEGRVKEMIKIEVNERDDEVHERSGRKECKDGRETCDKSRKMCMGRIQVRERQEEARYFRLDRRGDEYGL